MHTTTSARTQWLGVPFPARFLIKHLLDAHTHTPSTGTHLRGRTVPAQAGCPGARTDTEHVLASHIEGPHTDEGHEHAHHTHAQLPGFTPNTNCWAMFESWWAEARPEGDRHPVGKGPPTMQIGPAPAGADPSNKKTCLQVPTSVHPPKQTHTHTHTHTCANTCTHTHTHTHAETTLLPLAGLTSEVLRGGCPASCWRWWRTAPTQTPARPRPAASPAPACACARGRRRPARRPARPRPRRRPCRR